MLEQNYPETSLIREGIGLSLCGERAEGVNRNVTFHSQHGDKMSPVRFWFVVSILGLSIIVIPFITRKPCHDCSQESVSEWFGATQTSAALSPPEDIKLPPYLSWPTPNDHYSIGDARREPTEHDTENNRIGHWNSPNTTRDIDAQEPKFDVEACKGVVGPFVPWPPPQPSALTTFPTDWVLYFPTIADLDTILTLNLRKAGYDQFSYFSAPGGFALATRIEKIDAQGAPEFTTDRWSTDTAALPNSFYQYVEKVLFGKEGLYRIFVFFLTTDMRQPASEPAQFQIAEKWAANGCRKLPFPLSQEPIRQSHSFGASAYVFAAKKSETPQQITNFGVDMSTQLKFSGIVLQ